MVGIARLRQILRYAYSESRSDFAYMSIAVMESIYRLNVAITEKDHPPTILTKEIGVDSMLTIIRKRIES